MHRVAFFLLFALVLTIPWEQYFLLGELVGQLGTITRLFGYAVVLAGIAAVIGRVSMRRLEGIHVVMALFVIWAFLSLLWTVDAELSMIGVLTYTRVAGMAWLIWEFAPTISDQMLLMQAYVLGGYFAIGTEIAMIIDVPGLAPALRYSGGGLNANDLALTLVLTIPFAVYLAGTKRKNKILRLLNLAYVPLAGFAVLMTASRMGLILLCVSIGLITLRQSRRNILIGLLAAGAVAAFVMIVVPRIPERTLARLAGWQESMEGSWGMRRDILTEALPVAAAHFLNGTGVSTFQAVVQPPSAGYVGLAAHNAFLQVLVDLGIVGLLLFGSIVVLAARRIFKMPARERFLWMVGLVSWTLGACALTWDYAKSTWLIFGLLTAQHAALQAQLAGRAAQVQRLRLPRRQLPLGPLGSPS